jgi:hypothetical protein
MKIKDIFKESIVGLNITGDITKYANYVDKYLDELNSQNTIETDGVKKQLINQTNSNMKIFIDKIQQAFPKIQSKWLGSSVKVVPHFNTGWDFPIHEGCSDFSIYVINGKDKPDFTTFNFGANLGDVLDGGDEDFFSNPNTENDYFLLVNLLERPEIFDHPEREITLYTARPKKDREIFSGNTIPSNIFLTNDPDEAEGYARDFGDRDIYKVKIQQQYLTQTLNAGRKKNFQTVSPTGKVPVVWIDNLSESKDVFGKQTPSLEQIYQKWKHKGISLDYLKSQMKKGTAIEHEHTNDMLVANEICRDHLSELPDYYDLLANMEKKGKAELKEAVSPFSGKLNRPIEIPKLWSKPEDEPKQDGVVFGAYYKSTNTLSSYNSYNKFSKKKGPLGDGVYFTGAPYQDFDRWDVNYIEVAIGPLMNPIYVYGNTTTEAVKYFKSMKNKPAGYDGIIWLDTLKTIRGGVVFNSELIKYERNPRSLDE